MAASCSIETAASNALCGGIFADAVCVGGMAWHSFGGYEAGVHCISQPTSNPEQL